MSAKRVRKTRTDQHAGACRAEHAAAPTPLLTASRAAPRSRTGPQPLRFALIRPFTVGSPARMPWALVAAAALSLLSAMATPLLVAGLLGRFLTLSALAFAFFFSTLLVVLSRRLPAARAAAAPELVFDGAGLTLARSSDGYERLLSFTGGFGLTAFTTAARDILAVAITTPRGSLCVSAPVDAGERRLRVLTASAVVIDPEDLRFASILPDGTELQLQPRSVVKLLDALLALEPRAMQRCYLSDARGGVVLLDGTLLSAGARTFDLSEPFEWGASVFHERAGLADACFQAMWVRQAQEQIAFVSLLGSNDRSSLHQVLPAPPREVRHAVDRVLMLPLRNALLGAGEQRQRAAGGSSSA